MWAFDTKAGTKPIVAIIGVHCGFDKLTQENVGLCFMDIEHLIDLYG